MLFLAVLHQVLALLRREICLFRNIVAVLQLLLVGRKVGLRPSGRTSIQKVLPLLARKEAFGRSVVTPLSYFLVSFRKSLRDHKHYHCLRSRAFSYSLPQA
jgi:hypothetical protein